MTYGQIKFRIAKAFPGIDPDLIDGWISDTYQEILGSIPWSRLDVQATLTTVAATSLYALPANCRFVDEDAFSRIGVGTLRKLQTEEMQPVVAASGEPLVWWPAMDDSSTPPKMQVRLYPTPDKAYTINYTYCSEAAVPAATSTILQVWLQPSALIEGTSAKIKRHLKDYTGSALSLAAFKDALSNMRSDEAYRRGPVRMEMDRYYTAHRVQRWVR